MSPEWQTRLQFIISALLGLAVGIAIEMVLIGLLLGMGK